jgi:hypothetical protein
MKNVIITLLVCFSLVGGYFTLDHFMTPNYATQHKNANKIEALKDAYVIETLKNQECLYLFVLGKKLEILTPKTIQNVDSLMDSNVKLLTEGTDDLLKLRTDS